MQCFAIQKLLLLTWQLPNMKLEVLQKPLRPHLRRLQTTGFVSQEYSPWSSLLKYDLILCEDICHLCLMSLFNCLPCSQSQYHLNMIKLIVLLPIHPEFGRSLGEIRYRFDNYHLGVGEVLANDYFNQRWGGTPICPVPYPCLFLQNYQ